MATIRKCRGSPYWYAVYRDAAGRQCNYSTRIAIAGTGADKKEIARTASDNRRLAKEFAEELEQKERGHPTENQLRRLVDRLSLKVNQQRLEFQQTRKFLTNWVASIKAHRKDATWKRYNRVVEAFLEHLGPRADCLIGDVTVQDVQPFIDSLTKAGKSGMSVRMEAKVLSAGFAYAHRQGLITANPAAAVQLPDPSGETRTPFTWEQVQALIKRAPREWKTVILLGAYTGARLGDCIAMQWKHVDFAQHLLCFRPQKTSRKKVDLVVPIHPDLEAHLMKLPMPDGPAAAEAYLSPNLATNRIGGRRGISRQFQAIMAKADIDNALVRDRKGEGRRLYQYGFHSLRHTFNTLLLNAGVPQELRMKLSGHASEEMNTRYSHAELAILRNAVTKLPTLPHA
jgi:integrase